MKPFKDTYVMYQLLEFIDESSIIALCKASKKLNEICKNYIELEDDKRFEVIEMEDDLLEDYCKNNDVIKIRKMIKIKNIYWNWGLYGACRGGHIDIVKLMIKKGADAWNLGFEDACRGGHIDIVNLMIEKGATHWKCGLENACQNDYIDIVKLMIEKGAAKCYHCDESIEEHLKK